MSPDTAPQNMDVIDEKTVEKPYEQPGAAPNASPDILGFIDAIAGNRVHGWALDRNRPEDRLVVEISLDNTPLTTVCADEFRDHLVQAGIGDGAHGFTIELPEHLSKEERHRVTATVPNPSYGGAIRLKNKAALNTDALALRPSDYAALAEHLEQCVEDQRAGFRWVYQELHNLDEFVRSEARTIPTIAPAQPSVASDAVTGAIRTMETQVSEMVQNQTAVQDSLETMAALHKDLNRRLEQLDVFNARIDARLEGLQRPSDEEPENSDSQKGLKRLVFLLGCLTVASLAIGIRSLLN